MKIKLFLLIALAIVHMQVLTGFAQRDPSKEILVFFNEVVQRETRNENGVSTMRSMVKSDGLRTALSRIGINEQMLEVANPTFQEHRVKKKERMCGEHPILVEFFCSSFK